MVAGSSARVYLEREPPSVSQVKMPGTKQIQGFANVVANTSLSAAEHYLSSRQKEFLLPVTYEFLSFTLANTWQWLSR